ncbi:MAG: hypothetical protein SFV15_20135 [Polyangiaceae bacterium]|nr:hypothetical protein [Polyangiaceae bacterium]
MSNSDKPQKPSVDMPAVSHQDVALVHGVTPDGGYRIVRRRGEQLELGSVHPLKEGKPLEGEVVALRPRKEFPLVCDVETLYSPPKPLVGDTAAAPPAQARAKKGPAQVSTEAYRENWDQIWPQAKKNNAVN